MTKFLTRARVNRDVDGFVAVWSLAIFRPLLFFRAHEAGILTIESYAQGVLTCVPQSSH